ncbi:hypothetical protein [Bradyrhizobium embrapense]
MLAYRSRSGKAPGIIDADLERHGGRNGTDARNRHQAPPHIITLDDLEQHTVQPVVPLQDGATHIQHGPDGHYEDRMAALEKLADASLKGATGDRSNEQSIGTQRTTNVVLEVD